MFFSGDEVGILHYGTERRYGEMSKEKKIIKLIEYDDLIVVRGHCIEIWKSGTCLKHCTFDEAIITAFLYEDNIVVIQESCISVLDSNLKTIINFEGDFKQFLHFHNGHVFVGKSSIKIYSLGNSTHLEPVDKLKECKVVFLSKQKKNNANGVDSLSYNNVLVLDSTRFIAIQQNELHFYNLLIGKRPQKIVTYGLETLMKLYLVNSNQIILTDVVGHVYLYDIEKCIQIGKYKDIESISCATDVSISDNILYVSYLDRYVRVFDIATHKCLEKFFLKNKLTCILAEKQIKEQDVWDQLEQC